MEDRLIGSQLDSFRILEHLGRGGMADVYLAEDLGLRRRVVIKTMLPDGETVVLQSNAGGTHGIYLVDISTGTARTLYDSGGRDANPVVSPNGRWIAFESDQTGDYEIYVIQPDGSGLQNVTNSSSTRDQLPFFSPDGRWLLYQSSSGDGYDAYRLPFNPRE